MNIKDYIKDSEFFYAHKDGQNNSIETLEEHSELTLNYMRKIIKNKNLEPIIFNIGKSFLKQENSFQLWLQMFYNAIYLHDLGKVNINFQTKKMRNQNFKNNRNKKSNHSPLSAKFYFEIYFPKVKEIENKNDKKTLFIFLCLNMYVISRHHGQIKAYNSFSNEINNFISSITSDYESLTDNIINIETIKEKIYGNIFKREKKQREKLEEESEWISVELYIYTKLLFSLLVSSDFYATSDYMNGAPINDFGIIEDIENFYSIFKKTKTCKSIENYSKNRKESLFSHINEARSELFLEAEENLLKNKDKNLFYLEAPTGSGKTNTAINLSFNLLKNNKSLNKIFYIFPFNTLVEQTRQTLDDCFGYENLNSQISVINSLTPLYNEDEQDEDKVKIKNNKEKVLKEVDFTKILLDRQFIHYPIVLTTHVNLFNWLFGISREDNFPLVQLANSVIVLDEIQSYKNSIWKEISIFLNKYAKLLNIKIIIMSATLPKIGEMTNNSDDFISLITNRDKYFQCDFFKNRVTADFSLIDEMKKHDKEDFFKILSHKCIEEYQQNKKVLVEFINKKTSFDFFKLLKENYPDINTNLLNGDDNLVDRKKIIDEVKNSDSPIILVSTQVIEAGVDIDMDTGFKDISILDAEEQFMGRINRSCKKTNCKVYFFNYDDEKGIYKRDRRTEYTLLKEEVREILKNKKFDYFYTEILNKLQAKSKENNENNITKFKNENVNHLNFLEIQKKLRLIDKKEKEFTVFFNKKIKTEKFELSGDIVWNNYKKLLENNSIDYSEKRVKLSEIKSKLNYFTYKVKDIKVAFQDNIGDIFYIEDAEKYFDPYTLKFNRKKFEESESYAEFI